jgi:hypothetical protein
MKKVRFKEKTLPKVLYKDETEVRDHNTLIPMKGEPDESHKNDLKSKEQEALIIQANEENTFNPKEKNLVHTEYYACHFFLTYRDNDTELDVETIIDQLRRSNINMCTYTASEEVDPDEKGVHFHVLIGFKERVRIPKDNRKFDLKKFHIKAKNKDNNEETVVKPCYLKSILKKQVAQVNQYILKDNKYISNDPIINKLEYGRFLKMISSEIQATNINEADALQRAKESLGIEHYESKLSRIEKFVKKEIKQRENTGNIKNNDEDNDVYEEGWYEEHSAYIKLKEFLKSKLQRRKGNAFLIIGQSNVGKTQMALHLVRKLGMTYIHTSSVNAVSKEDQTLLKNNKIGAIIFDDCIQLKNLNVNELSTLLTKKTSNMDIKYGSLKFSQDIKKIILSSPNTTNPAFIPEPNPHDKNVFSNRLFEVDQVIEHIKEHNYYEILNRLIEKDNVKIVVVNEPLYHNDQTSTINIGQININITQNNNNLTQNNNNNYNFNTYEQSEELKKVDKDQQNKLVDKRLTINKQKAL